MVIPVLAIHVLALVVRLWQLDRIGYNSDEAVYAGSAASIAGNAALHDMFPIFRAHPVLFQSIVSLGFHGGVDDWTGRAFSAVFGVATVAVVYVLGRRLYGPGTGLIAALVLALMPYHVIVTRQVLLDGPATFLATAALYCTVRYAESTNRRWLMAAAGMFGAAVLTKETSLVLLGGLYAFFALTPAIRIRLSHVAPAVALTLAMSALFPLVASFSGKNRTGRSYLLWQIFRPANHEWFFYFKVVPPAVGVGVVVTALLGLIWLWRERGWRERLLVCWVVVPVLFFTAWPVKGYQYLLPIAPALAVLAARTLVRVARARPARWPAGSATVAAAVLTAVLSVSLAVPVWATVNPSTTGTFLAGTGGLPGGREAGQWVAANVPEGARLLAIGPSMANVLQFYGHRRVFALSVSPNPRSRNPVYVPVPNPDRELRTGSFQYIVWDSYTANRAQFFGATARELVDRYHGVAVYVSSVTVADAAGNDVPQPVIVIYKVRTR
jgi:4-amino-4-deoxy-L-arabinose transferase-like glycosyltransferase